MKTVPRLLPPLLGILIWVVSGCSHTYTVTFDNETPRGDTVAVATLNRRCADRSATVLPRNGKEFAVSDVLLTRDSCLFTGDSGRGYVPTAEVLSIRRVDHFSGAIGGFGLGLVGGLVVGYAVAKVAQAESGDSMSGMVGIVPMVLAPIIGLGVGAAIGTKTEYQLPEATPDSTGGHSQGRLPFDSDHMARGGSGANGS
jgi:hypothetical protein